MTGGMSPSQLKDVEKWKLLESDAVMILSAEKTTPRPGTATVASRRASPTSVTISMPFSPRSLRRFCLSVRVFRSRSRSSGGDGAKNHTGPLHLALHSVLAGSSACLEQLT